jgi:NADPH:quinone reductase
MRAIRITQFGGPEVLRVVDDQPEPQAGPGTSVLQVGHAGINYADTHQAENSYLAPAELPLVPGAEAVGTLEDGRRVVALLAGGGYAERAVAAHALCFDVPDTVEDGQALAARRHQSSGVHHDPVARRSQGHPARRQTGR